MIGLTSLVAVTGLVFLMFLFGELETLLKPRYTLTLNCTNAGGLRVGSVVELNGVPVGVVEAIKSNPPPSRYPVRVLAGIDEDVLIPNDVTPYATSSLLGASASASRLSSSMQSLTSTYGRSAMIESSRMYFGYKTRLLKAS